MVSPPGSSGSTASSGQELTYISKYIVQYFPGTPKPKATTRRVSGYRVLTSSKCLAEFEEKESKKKKEAEEKDKRKQERAKKKQQRHELLKQKAEEKARKAEEKKKCDEEKSKTKTSRAQKRSNTTIKSNGPKRVRLDEVGSDTILKPNESKRAWQKEVRSGEH